MRTVCTGCGTLGTMQNAAELGHVHEGCACPPGEWAPFPELPPRLVIDLACHQLIATPAPVVLRETLQLLEFLDWSVFADAGDMLVNEVKTAIDRRLATGRWLEWSQAL